jgi:ribokinase
VPGANSRLLPADIDALRPLVEAAAVVVLQCEILPATLYRAIELAAESNTPVVLNPAPYRGLDLPRIAHAVTYLVPNETEAAQLWGQPVDTHEQAQACAVWLRAAGCGSVIITLGANGCFFADEHTLRHHPGHRVQAIDTTGAGDAFVGCLAAALAHGRSRDESIRRALLYSALSTTRRGAQVSYPDGGEFERAWSASPGLRSG